MLINYQKTANTYFNNSKIKSFYYFGNLDILKNIKVCVVGSRKITPYGELVVKKFVKELKDKSITTVSGFVEGVDFEVFKQSLLNHVFTIAVLGYGFNFFNYDLLKKCLKIDFSKVLFISEFEPNESPKKWTFPKRDETLATISNLVFVVEANEKSGTFYTVKRAFLEDKKVYAAPGSIFSYNSRGCLHLIKVGFNKKTAIVYTKPQDILDNYFLTKKHGTLNTASLSKIELKILNILASQNMHFDELQKRINLEYKDVVILLSNLELQGFIINKNGFYHKNI